MMDHQWLTEGGASGQTIQLVHTPVGVECSTDQGRAQTPRKFNSVFRYFIYFDISFKTNYILKANRFVQIYEQLIIPVTLPSSFILDHKMEVWIVKERALVTGKYATHR